jgi:hypothetical protein
VASALTLSAAVDSLDRWSRALGRT